MGRHYDSAKCVKVEQVLEQSFSTLQGLSCSETACGWFEMKFEITNYLSNHAAIINSELETLFVAVNGFNCPAY